MKLERSETWNTSRTAWRVTSWYFAWGPWCYSRREATVAWGKTNKSIFLEFFGMPFVRLWRWYQHHCLVCGRNVECRCLLECNCGHYRYCSLECAAYDEALKDPRKSWVLFGRLKEPKRHHEADMHDV